MSRFPRNAVIRVEDVREMMRDCGWPRSTGPARRAIVSLLTHIEVQQAVIDNLSADVRAWRKEAGIADG